MKKRSFVALFLLLALLVPSAAFAEGFGIYEWSASGTAMGEAYMFGENDPSVLAYNPAAITRLNGSYFSLGATFVNPANHTTFDNTPGGLNTGISNSWDNNYSPATAPYMYYASKAGKNSWWGIAIFPRYGNQMEYDRKWAGRYDTIFSSMQSISVQPTYAWKMGDKWSAAVGVDLQYVGLRMKKATPGAALAAMMPEPYKSLLPGKDVFSDLDGSSFNVGGVFSLMYDFTPNTSAALVYRTRIKQDMDADMDFSVDELGVTIPTKAHGSVTLPDSITLGIGHKFNEGRTRVEFDAVWTNWATYDALNLNIDGLPVPVNSPKNWDASWRFGLGIEHRLSDKWSIMGGYVWDQSPVPDETVDFTVPTGDRHRGSIGFKYRPNDRSEWSIAYTAIWAGDRDSNSRVNNFDYTKSYIRDGLTQLFSLGYTIKLK